jgi:hypothetical protein
MLLFVVVIVSILWSGVHRCVAEDVTTLSTTTVINGPPDDPILQWATECGTLDEPMFLLMEHILPQTGGRFYDLTAGFGSSFLRLATIVGPTGGAVGVDRNSTLLAYLNDNIQRLNYWSRSLIVANYNESDTDGRFYAHNFFGELFAMLSYQCPHVLHWRDSGVDFQDLPNVFRDIQFLFTRCNPVLFFDFVRPKFFVFVVQSMLEYHKFSLYFRPLCCSTQQRFSLFSIRTETLNETTTELLKQYGYLPISPSVSSIALVKQLGQVCSSQSFADGNVMNEQFIEERRKRPYIGSVEVEFDMILFPLGPLECLYRQYLSAPGLFSLTPSDFLYMVDIFDDSGEDIENINEMVLNSECIAWISLIVDQLQIQFDRMSVCHNGSSLHAQNSIENDKHLLTSNCFRFVRERQEFLQSIFDRRQLSLDFLLFPQLSTDDGVRRDIQYDFHAFTESSRVLQQWFPRKPLQTQFEPEICSEPIYCDYGERLRDSVRRWQRPPQTHLQALSVQVEQKEHNETHNILQTFPHDSCENAKFLIYEPTSAHNGLGSMFLLLSSALRHAICLGRILVLGTHEQDSTLLKWRHPGCFGNTFECYFEPISSCKLPYHEVANLTRYASNAGFDEFPLRNERILFLKGLPSHGPCALCFSEWDKSSKLLDGLIKMNFEGNWQKDAVGESLTSAAKLPWHSQLTRDILRPRQWFTHAMRDIVHSTMLSPVNSSINVNRFPQNFVSLHIRHGNKVIETKLFPIQDYMRRIKRKFPWVSDIFVSTETKHLIDALIR